MSYQDYYLRCSQDDVPALMELAVELGILRLEGVWYVPVKDCWVWVPIGLLYEGESPIRNVDGVPYWHANLRLDCDLYAMAQDAYRTRPSPVLAYGLTHIGEFFYVGQDGRAKRPAEPQVVFL